MEAEQQKVAGLRIAIDEMIARKEKPQQFNLIDAAIKKEEGKKDKDQEKIATHLKRREELVKEFGSNMREAFIEKVIPNSTKIFQVTHVAKYSNPDIGKADNVFLRPKKNNIPDNLVGTNSLKEEEIEYDLSGPAQFLNLASLLRVKFAGLCVLDLLRENAEFLVSAFSDNRKESTRWMSELSKVAFGEKHGSTHPLAKQLYFPIDERGGYHQLAPLFPSSLVQTVYSHFQDAQFSDASIAARKAKKDNSAHEQGYADYPNLAIQTFGGTKPQNISQLNSERHGEAWLLASYPPTWRRRGLRPPLYVSSVFNKRFRARSSVNDVIGALAKFLVKVSDYNNLAIREKRAAMVAHVVDELLAYSWDLHETVESGWSADANCKLPECECLWLDPGRAGDDPDFAEALQAKDWQGEVAGRFAGWFNAQLRHHSKGRTELQVGENEQKVWKSEMLDALKEMEMYHG